MTAERLSLLQKRRLAERAHRWVATIKRINDPVDAPFDPSKVPWDVAVDNVHLLALALEHLKTCMTLLLGSGERIEGAEAFLTAWARVAELRNALEHEEEYVAGRGRNPALYTQDWRDRGMSESRALVWDDQGIVAVSFMGRSYDLAAAIRAAVALEEALLSLWNPPIEFSATEREDLPDG